MNFKKSKNVNGSIRIVDVKSTVCLVLITALFSTLSLNAQTTPEPPTPPSTSSSSSTSSHSIDIDTDDEKYNSSVSTSISDDSYKFRASYHKSKNEGVKSILIKQLGKGNLNIKGSTYLWTDNKNGDEVFECKLTKGHLRIYLDTEVASEAFAEKVKNLGKDIKHYISGTDSKKESERQVAKAKRELERAERELARAKREANRAAKN